MRLEFTIILYSPNEHMYRAYSSTVGGRRTRPNIKYFKVHDGSREPTKLAVRDEARILINRLSLNLRLATKR